MPKLCVYTNKTLKLTNVLVLKINIALVQDIPKYILQMDNYIKSLGNIPIGPIIQYSKWENNNEGKQYLTIKLMRQMKNFVFKIKEPYEVKSNIIVNHCMYTRFVGEQKLFNYAYDKTKVTAFEEDISLSGNCYTVFIRNDNNSDIIADVFMERAD